MPKEKQVARLGLLKELKCSCGSVQFSYSGKCLSCKKTKEERDLINKLIEL